MKQYTLITLFTLLLSQVVNANDVTISSKAMNNESELCLNAVKGNQTISEIAAMLGINERNIDRRIQCNGIGINAFVEKFSANKAVNVKHATLGDYALTTKHANASGQLCVIAASGDINKLQRAVKSQGMNIRYFVKHTKCNGLPVVNFTKKYSEAQTAAALSKYL